MSHRALSQELFSEHTAVVEKLKSQNPTKFWSVSTPGEGYKTTKLGERGYVATKQSRDSVDVGGLIGRPGHGGVAKAAFASVDRSHPEHPQTLDAFDEQARSGNINLPKLYEKHGFKETGRLGFDPQYAPPQWDESKHGRPDVVFMARPAAQGSLFPNTHPTTPPPAQGNFPPKKRRQVSGQMPLPGL